MDGDELMLGVEEERPVVLTPVVGDSSRANRATASGVFSHHARRRAGLADDAETDLDDGRWQELRGRRRGCGA